MLNRVRWLTGYGAGTRGGSTDGPVVGDEVLVNLSGGQPIIIGCLEKATSSPPSSPTSLAAGSSPPVTAMLGNSKVVRQGQYGPTDSVPGDKIISSSGGGLIANLRDGTLLLRASRAAELVLHRLSGYVRLVSRSWDHYSDAHTESIHNLSGRVFKYQGYSPFSTESMSSTYRYHAYFGDVAAAESVKGEFFQFSGSPPVNTLLYKSQVTTTTGVELMRYTVSLTGDQESYVTRQGGSFTRTNQTPDQIRFSWNDEHYVLITQAKIELYRSGSTVTLNQENMTLNIGNSTVTLTGSDINLNSSGHNVLINSSGVEVT